MNEVIDRITAYLSEGGLFNPELANHDTVRDLLIDCRAALASAAAPQPNTAYAALPDTYYLAGGEVKTWDENHMLAFADATHALRAFHVQAPAVAAVEIHEAKCPALIGDACSCERSDPAVDKAWARFCGGIGDGPDAPYPGMISAFERYYSQSFIDKDWRNEASVWAAAWKQALLTAAAPTTPQADSVLEDAARYRWLRDCNLAKFPEINSAFYLGNKNLDTAIDAARSRSEGKQREQDEALIRQLVVALEAMRSEAAARHCGLLICDEAITAARARLEGKP